MSTVRRRRSSTDSLRALGLTLALAACAGLGAAPPATSTTSLAPTSAPSSTTTTSAPPSTIAPPPTTTTLPETTTTAAGLPDGTMVIVPDGVGPFPAVVLVHGGSWVGGSPRSLEPLAGMLADRGFLVVNTAYRLATLREPSFPQAAHDVACAVRHAAHHPASDGTVALVGHSAGAHLAAVVALDPGSFGEGCDETREARAGLLAGLAGPYEVTRLGLLASPLFGVMPAEDPDLWSTGNPHDLADPGDEVAVLLVHGEDDSVVPVGFTTRFAGILGESGIETTVEVLPGVTHRTVIDPAVTGAIVADWLIGNGVDPAR